MVAKVNNPPELSINVDAELIAKIFKNIMENAIEHSEQSGKIEINASTEKGYTVIEFIDHGKGFSEKALNNALKPFAISKSYLHQQDNKIGLNLYTAKLVMDNHEGNIEISNTKDKGARVSLQFKSE